MSYSSSLHFASNQVSKNIAEYLQKAEYVLGFTDLVVFPVVTLGSSCQTAYQKIIENIFGLF